MKIDEVLAIEESSSSKDKEIEPEWSKDSQISSSSDYESGTKAQRLLWWRDDVVNKTLLRCIKRFYLNEFKSRNKEIVRKRYVNTSSELLLDRVESLCSDLFPNIKKRDLLSQFMFIIIDIKEHDGLDFNKTVEKKGKSVVSCMKSYTTKKFNSLYNQREIKKLARYVFENHLETLITSEKAIQANKDRYLKAIEDFIE